MQNVKVSVIVPVYNYEAHIADTMAMLLASTLPEIQVVAVNDGSKDGSLAVLQECAAADSRITVVDKPNGGIFDARNAGLKACVGEYICFCDQDDVVEPQMYEIMYEKGQECQAELVMCSHGRLTADGKVPGWNSKDLIIRGKDEVRNECFLSNLFQTSKAYQTKHNLRVSNNIWKCAIKNDFIREHAIVFRRYLDFEDDRLFLLDALSHANCVRCIPDILYYWRVDLKSESHDYKYVENLYNKDRALEEDYLAMARQAGCTEEQLAHLRELNGAIRYSQLVYYEIVHKGAKLSDSVNAIKVIYDEPDFKKNIRRAKELKNNLIARKFMLALLSMHCTLLAFVFWKAYDGVRRGLQAKAFWNNLERKVSGK